MTQAPAVHNRAKTGKSRRRFCTDIFIHQGKEIAAVLRLRRGLVPAGPQPIFR